MLLPYVLELSVLREGLTVFVIPFGRLTIKANFGKTSNTNMKRQIQNKPYLFYVLSA